MRLHLLVLGRAQPRLQSRIVGPILDRLDNAADPALDIGDCMPRSVKLDLAFLRDPSQFGIELFDEDRDEGRGR